MPITLSIVSSAVLLLAVWRVWRTAYLPETPITYGPEAAGKELEWCPKEFVSAVFSTRDQEFVAKLHSKGLEALFLQERKFVASSWVRAIARGVHKILREHVEIARHSEDLEIGTEFAIYLRYVTLQASCLFLLAFIALFGPMRLRSLASHVYDLSERLSQAHWALKSATQAGATFQARKA